MSWWSTPRMSCWRTLRWVTCDVDKPRSWRYCCWTSRRGLHLCAPVVALNSLCLGMSRWSPIQWEGIWEIDGLDCVGDGRVSFRSCRLSFHLNNSSTEISTRKHTRDRKIIIRVKLSFTRIIFVEMANNRVDRFVVKIGQLDYFTSIIQSHANKWTGITTLIWNSEWKQLILIWIEWI